LIAVGSRATKVRTRSRLHAAEMEVSLMTKSVSSLVLDNGPQYLIDNVDRQIICAGAPASYAAAIGANLLVERPTVPGDFALAAGVDAGSRAVTLAAANDIAVTVAGVADHSALVDDTNLRLLLVDEITPNLPISLDAPVDIDPLVYEIKQPV
jgi:hypothetical protein